MEQNLMDHNTLLDYYDNTRIGLIHLLGIYPPA